jgi:hypothetical protein
VDRYRRDHLADATLLAHVRSSLANERIATADLLADLAEIDARKLYREAAYPSMLAWCVGELHLCEHAALKRIRAARIAREFPALFGAVADGRLHLTAVIELKPKLSQENLEELITAAAYRTQHGVRLMLAERFPRVIEGTAQTASCAATTCEPELAAQPVVRSAPEEEAPPLELSAPTPPAAPEVKFSGRGRLTPLSADVFDLHVMIRRGTREVLEHVQNLLGHAIPPGEVAEVLDRALRHYARHLEKRKFGATDRPRPSAALPTKATGRYIPAPVRQLVWERDGGRCTFESATGKRCDARHGLEFDHIVPVGRGGESTVDNLRLRCREHNQLEAERTYGAEFMKNKRNGARQSANGSAVPGAAPVPAGKREATSRPIANLRSEEDPARDGLRRDTLAALRVLGFRARDAERAAEFAMQDPGASLEGCVRAALAWLVQPQRRTTRPAEAAPDLTAMAS